MCPIGLGKLSSDMIYSNYNYETSDFADLGQTQVFLFHLPILVCVCTAS